MNAHIPCMLKGEPVHFVIQSKDKNGNGALATVERGMYRLGR